MKEKNNIAETRVREANIRLHRLIASEYSDRKAIYHPAVIENVEKFMTAQLQRRHDNGKILAVDVCCGTGFAGELLEKLGYSVAGFDLVPEMIAEAKKIRPAGIFAVGDVFFPPFKPGIFDVVVVSGALHHIIDFEGAMNNILSLASPQATVLILNEPNLAGYRMLRPFRFATSRLLPERRVSRRVETGELAAEDEALAEFHINYGHGLDPARLAEILSSSGFQVSTIEFTNLNIIANLGDRSSFDFLKTFPFLKRLNFGKSSLEFNLAAKRLR